MAPRVPAGNDEWRGVVIMTLLHRLDEVGHHLADGSCVLVLISARTDAT